MLLMMVIGGVSTGKKQSRGIVTLGMEALPHLIYSRFQEIWIYCSHLDLHNDLISTLKSHHLSIHFRYTTCFCGFLFQSTMFVHMCIIHTYYIHCLCVISHEQDVKFCFGSQVVGASQFLFCLSTNCSITAKYYSKIYRWFSNV